MSNRVIFPVDQDSIADRELRLECAKLADGRIEDAREIYAFVTGESDVTPRQAIEEALERAGVR